MRYPVLSGGAFLCVKKAIHLEFRCDSGDDIPVRIMYVPHAFQSTLL